MNSKTILLVNPNTYHTPPVPPLGLEYVAHALAEDGWDTRVADLCFEDDPVAAAQRAAREFSPLFAGVTVRNIDSALYQNNIFFLPGIREIVDVLKAAGTTVVIGGCGPTAAPREVLDETGADIAVEGPGQAAAVAIARSISSGKMPERIINGWNAGIGADSVPRHAGVIDYGRYAESGGIPGFTASYGCTGPCPYCIESGRPPILRDPATVAAEIAALSSRGLKHFHLCDSEFNQDLEHCESVASAIASGAPGIQWALYMKPVPWSRRLFENLRRSGAYLVTLSVDSLTLNSKTPWYSYSDLEGIVAACRDLGIKLAVDLITGLPGEDEGSARETISFFKGSEPDTVGVNSYIRLYPGTTTTHDVLSSKELRGFLTGPATGNLMQPVFYCHIGEDRIAGLIGGHRNFRIEGFERTTNYERIDDGRC